MRESTAEYYLHRRVTYNEYLEITSKSEARFEDDPNVVQPDILVICDEEQIDETGQYYGVPTLVVEVLSPSTRSRDMVKKLSLYMLSGVLEYWIVDLDQNQVLIYAMHKGKVDSLQVVAIGETVHSKHFKGLAVDTSAF